MVRKKSALILLLLACIGSFALVLPTINKNIDKLNLIFYYNADEGGQMDLIWSYYSGEVRSSFLFDFDYGLEMLYIADFSKFVLSRFIRITPGVLILLLRWLHLFAWVGALIALYKFIGYHFGKGWQQFLGVALLAVRPALAYVSLNAKPEPLVLLLLILGLDYTLRIIDKPSKRNLLFAVACAAIAAIVKFSGIFLLPAIILSLMLSNRYNANAKDICFKINEKISRVLPAMLGILLMLLIWILLFFYVRKSTGRTWYEQYSFMGSLIQNKPSGYLFICGILLILLTLVLLQLGQSRNCFANKVICLIDEVNSYTLTVFLIFFACILFFGFKWLLSPKFFILTYAPLFAISTTSAQLMISQKGLLAAFIENCYNRIIALDPYILGLFLYYIALEIFFRRELTKADLLKALKRWVLVFFLIPPILLMFFMLKMAQHHMLIFFVIMAVLCAQGITITRNNIRNSKLSKIAIYLIVLLLCVDVASNANALISARIKAINKHKNDISIEMADWFYKNIPVDAKIVSDHYQSVCISDEYKNIAVFNSCTGDEFKAKIDKIRALVNSFKPEFIFLNVNGECYTFPPINEILPNERLKVVKIFENHNLKYQVKENAKFILYSRQ